MHHKDIKAIIRKQLKTNYRDWEWLKKREQKEIAKEVLDEVVTGYDFKKEVETDTLKWFREQGLFFLNDLTKRSLELSLFSH